MSCKRKDCDWVRIGDRVRIVDSSWSMGYSQGKVRRSGLLPSDWKVVATDLVLPTESGIPSDYSPNDTIIWNSLNGITIFIRHHFLEPVDVKFVTCKNCGEKMRVE